MSTSLNENSICIPSEDVIAREIGGEMLIIPLVAGIVEADDAIYTLSPTAQAIWTQLDGKQTLHVIIAFLSQTYDAPAEELKNDVLGFVAEMVDHSIISVIKS
ncbi:PqqD family protein [Chloroflexota bacterium]